MKILHVSWEYPPIIYGGLGRHVAALTAAQSALGHDVHVLTQHPAGTDRVELTNGVTVHRVSSLTPPVVREATSIIGWTQQLDHALAEELPSLLASIDPDIVHGHDWVVEAAMERAASLGRTTVLTVHATEAGRHSGWIHNDVSRTVDAAEWRATQRADRLVVCSSSMQREVSGLFERDSSEIDVIPNGIDLTQWQIEPTERVPHQIAFVGRLQWEKGVQVLLAAIARIRRTREVTAVIAGTGTFADQLHELVDELDLHTVVTMTGAIDDPAVKQLVAQSAVSVVPSLYEPFGMVALEAAALDTPLVVTHVGGLGDIVEDKVTGRVVPADDPAALAAAIDETLAHPEQAAQRAKRLRQQVADRYAWTSIAQALTQTYDQAIAHPRSPATASIEAPSRPDIDLLAELR